MKDVRSKKMMNYIAVFALGLIVCACEDTIELTEARGPASLMPASEPLNDFPLSDYEDQTPTARLTTPPTAGAAPICDGGCADFCEGLNLNNPINRGMCRSTWGAGLSTAPVEPYEACRRLYMDLVGRFPSGAEAKQTCIDQGFSQTAASLIESEEYVDNCRRKWAENLELNNEATSILSILDFDLLAERMCRGTIGYNAFAEVAASHPVLTRRFDTPADRAEFAFNLFLGRQPFENERADFARMYHLWSNDYIDSPGLGARVPDAWLSYRCLGQDGEPDNASACTSILWGFEPVVLKPDLRASREQDGVAMMWNGLLRAEEWQVLQAPGRVLARQSLFWEFAVERALEDMMGYDLARAVPGVRDELVRELVTRGGDIRVIEFAVATSLAYLQSSSDQSSAEPMDSEYRWTYGPLKQTHAEGWVDSLSYAFDVSLGGCDPRITQPGLLLDTGSPTGYAIVKNSAWPLRDDGRINRRYSDLVSTLGGCPDHAPGGRFTIVSVLTTGTQLGFADDLCDPSGDEGDGGNFVARASRLLPDGVDPETVVDASLATQILSHQTNLLLGRSPNESERTEIAEAGTGCATQRCPAEQFARQLCFAVASSAEVVFY